MYYSLASIGFGVQETALKPPQVISKTLGQHLKMKASTRKLLLSNLVGLGLAGVAISAYTAGIYFEILIVSLPIAIIILTNQFIQEKKWVWRIIFAGLIGFQLEAFSSPPIIENFQASMTGFYLTTEQIENIEWIMPVSAAFCVASFWVVFIRTFKTERKNKKMLPHKK